MDSLNHLLLTRETVISAVNCIVAACRPRMILVFGSRARGNARADSDLDLLVVLQSECSDVTGLRWQLRSLLKELPVAKDILVSGPEHFAFWSRHHNSVYRTAVEEGLPLWKDGCLNEAVAARVCR